jgi:FkbM family methyltransferase
MGRVYRRQDATVSEDALTHHPAFYEFPLGASPPEAGFSSDFSGARLRCQLMPYSNPNYPDVDEEYFEWIDIVESVLGAKGRYVLAELGAGYGRWAARAACLARGRALQFHVIAVEAEPLHFQWLQETLRDNGVEPGEKTEINAAVASGRGTAQFYVEADGGLNASSWYGQCIAFADTVGVEGTYAGRAVTKHASGCKSICVETVTLPDILLPFPLVDLIDMDVQGEELAVVSSSLTTLNAKVRRLHIGTHSAEIEAGIRAVMAAEGWQCIGDYPGHAKYKTLWGEIAFSDGVQSWVNPRL